MTGVVTIRTPLLDTVTVKDGMQKTLLTDILDKAIDQVGRYKQSQRHGEEDPVSGHASHHPSTSWACKENRACSRHVRRLSYGATGQQECNAMHWYGCTTGDSTEFP